MARLSSQIKGEANRIRKAALWVAQQTILDVIEHAQRTQPSVRQTGGSFEIGKIPVLTSELVNSLAVNGGPASSDSYAAPIMHSKLGDTLSFRWIAPHAAPIEYGFTTSKGTKVPGRFFVTTACDRFMEFAAKRASEVK